MSYKKSQYHEDSDADADDEYERSVIASPALVHDYESSPTESDPPSNEHTPTTFTHGIHTASPKGLITQWTADQCADYVSSLGLSQYADAFLDEAITGDALIAILQPDLKEMGVTSLGHRLTILKGIYDLKKRQNVPVEPDHFVPLSVESTANDNVPNQDDIARIIRIIKERDERIHTAENELRILRDDLNRIADENRRLREDMLPLAIKAKNNTQALPDPSQENSNGLSRKMSTRKLFTGGNLKNPSPTVSDRFDGSTLDPSAAAVLASNHLTAQMRDDKTSPQFAASPTSPAYAPSTARSRHYNDDHGTESWTSNASHASTIIPDGRSRYRSNDLGDPPNSGDSIRGTITPSLATANLTRNPLDTPSAGTINAALATPSSTGPPSAAGSSAISSSVSTAPSSAARSDAGGSNPQVEIFKSFRVSIDDPCHKVLPVALKKYNITADWRQYALYIVHGDQERCLGLNERPLILFKQLDKEGRKPMFMLRKHAQPIEGHVNTIGQGPAAQVPGGVL